MSSNPEADEVKSHRLRSFLLIGASVVVAEIGLVAVDEAATGGSTMHGIFTTSEVAANQLPWGSVVTQATPSISPTSYQTSPATSPLETTATFTPSPTPSPEQRPAITQAGSPDMPCQPGQKIGDITTDVKEVALTIDDGPSPSTTRAIVRQFKETGSVGTFFFLGSRLETTDGQAIARDVLAEGSEIGVHSYSHYLNDPDHNAAEQDKAIHAFQTVLGAVPFAYRAPGFAYSPKLERVVRASGQCFISISAQGDTNDWKSDFEDPATAAAEIRQRDDEVLANLQPGFIILAHDQITDMPVDGGRNRPRTTGPEHVRYLIEQIQARGYKLVTIETLLRDTR